ncbi:retrovirus-related pol polyprotein from transposon TNT 1-94 [Tanacetum coccineum]
MHDGIVRKFDCWFVPGLKKNLISLGTLANNGLKYHGEGEWVKVSKGALVLMKGKLQHGIYFLQGSSVIGTAAVSQSSDKRDDRTNLWHRRLGHMSEQGLSVLSKQGLLGGDVTDLWGPSPVKSQGGCVYFVTFIDDYSRKVKTPRTDNGLEFCNAPFDNFCKKEAVNTASYLVNRSPSTAIGIKMPQKVWSDKLSDYFDLRIFGCLAYDHVNDECKSPNKFIISRDVTFDESAILGQSRGCESFTGIKDCGADQKVEFETRDRVVIEEEQQEKNNTDQPEQPEQSEPQVEPVEEEADNTDSVSYTLAVGDDIGSDDPKTYKEAVASKDAENWIIAMNEEIQSLEKNKIWDLVTLPKGVKPVGYKWVLKIKEGIPSVKLARFKA